MSKLDILMNCIINFPPGTLVRLELDCPEDPPREVTGINMLGDTPYLIFLDGHTVCASREDLIQKLV